MVEHAWAAQGSGVTLQPVQRGQPVDALSAPVCLVALPYLARQEAPGGAKGRRAALVAQGFRRDLSGSACGDILYLGLLLHSSQVCGVAPGPGASQQR